MADTGGSDSHAVASTASISEAVGRYNKYLAGFSCSEPPSPPRAQYSPLWCLSGVNEPPASDVALCQTHTIAILCT